MKRIALGLFIASALFAGISHPGYVSADALCYQNAAPTPIPTAGSITLGICDAAGHLLTTSSGGPTPIPFPTSTSGVPLVQPTNVPTLNALVSGTGTAGTPATGVVTVQGVPFGYGLIVQIGGSTYTSITSASPTTCTGIETNANGMLAEIEFGNLHLFAGVNRCSVRRHRAIE